MKLMKSNGAIVFALILLLSNLGLADAIAEDSKVTTEFTLKLQDGTVVATTEGKEPVTFQMGSKAMMPAVQSQMVGLEAGDTKTLTLAPAQSGSYQRDRDREDSRRASKSGTTSLLERTRRKGRSSQSCGSG